MAAIAIGSTRCALSAVERRSCQTLRKTRVPAQLLRRAGGTTLQRRHHSTGAASSSSVSPSEISHFSRLASTWWDPHGPSRLLHLMNPLRHDFIQQCLKTPSPAASASAAAEDTSPPRTYSFLDIGCGGGIFASSAARLPTTSTVTAIDPTSMVIQVAQSHQRTDPALSEPKLRYLNCAIEDLPVPATDEEKVDILTLFEVIEHIDSPSSFLELAIPHLKPGGWIVGSTISRSRTAYLTTKLVAEAPLIGVVPPGTHDWNKYINPPELRQYFETRAPGKWGDFRTQGVMYIPMLGWRVVNNSEEFGNYFFGVQKLD